MTPAKRALDVALALTAMALLALPFAGLLALLWALQGRPLFHASTRMHAPGRSFRLWKLRSMRPVAGADGISGGHQRDRVTPIGRILRRLRLDEVPQLWNILRGDMSFVGPRPPLPGLVALRPDLFADVLRSRPGLTGLATLRLHAWEERLLASCRTAAEAEAVYARRCLPRKARLDLIYQRRRSVALDLALIARTLARLVRSGAPA
jgi:lipopolysaccharide/colanic/teichoic acid biosynthesis glycosyltransferase